MRNFSCNLFYIGRRDCHFTPQYKKGSLLKYENMNITLYRCDRVFINAGKSCEVGRRMTLSSLRIHRKL